MKAEFTKNNTEIELSEQELDTVVGGTCRPGVVVSEDGTDECGNPTVEFGKTTPPPKPDFITYAEYLKRGGRPVRWSY